MKRFLPIILLILIPVGAHSQTLSQLDLELVGNDASDITNGDIDTVWVGSTNDYLVFVVRFNGVDDLGTSINITLQDASANDYLLYASIYNETYIVSVHDGMSLTSPDYAPDDNPIQYIEKTIYYNSALNELGVYFYWDDIGGENEVDFIIWNDSQFDDVDRVPDSFSYHFDSVVQVDRTLDFSAALDGVFEEPTTSTNPPTSSTQDEPRITRTSDETISENSGSNSTTAILMLLVIGLLFFYVVRLNVGKRKPTVRASKPMKKAIQPKSLPSNVKPETVATKFISELGRDVRMCCFQTARLDETYCYCGRVVEEDVKALFRTDS